MYERRWPTVFLYVIILLAFTLFIAVAAEASDAQEPWQYADNDTLTCLAAGPSGTLYAYFGNTMVALDSQCNQLWNLTFPGDRRICDRLYLRGYLKFQYGYYYLSPFWDMRPVYDEDNGTLYLYVRPPPASCQMAGIDGRITPVDTGEMIAAISPQGKILWETTLSGPPVAYDDTAISAQDGRVFVFHQYNLTVLDRDGRVLFDIADVSDPAAVGPDGTIYVSRCRPPDAPPDNILDGMDYRIPSGVIEAYDPGGTLRWRYVADRSLPGASWQGEETDTLPVYRDGRLYLPARDGIVVLDCNGSVLWSRTFEGKYNLGLFCYMPFDADGNVYLRNATGPEEFYVMDKNGNIVLQNGIRSEPGQTVAAHDGILYYRASPVPEWDWSPDSLEPMSVEACGIVNGTDLWAVTLPLLNTTITTVDDLNVYRYFATFRLDYDPSWADLLVLSNRVNCTLSTPGRHLEEVTPVFRQGLTDTWLTPGNDVLYAGYYTMGYDDPVRFNVSRVASSSNVYALAWNGTLVWSRSLGSIFRFPRVENDTLYYGAGDGISGAGAWMPAGTAAAAADVAVMSITYLIVKVFFVGILARLKELLPENGNRSKVLDYVRADPGASLYEICRGTGLNVGTVRYHLWVLESNHRIASVKAGKKSFRFFPNSRTYSDEEQIVRSLMKRDTVKRILAVLAEKPGMTNRELSGLTGIKEGAMSKYMNLLIEQGIVDRASANGRREYRIRSECIPAVKAGIDGTGAHRSQ